MTRKQPASLAGVLTAATETAEQSAARPPSRRGTVGWLIYLPAEQHRRLKVAAVLNGTSLQRIGEAAAEWALERYGNQE